MEKSRKPKIRFKGFNDDWEQRKVGELLIERNQQAPMSEEYPLMAFVANEGVTPKGERYDRSALVTDTKNKLYKKTEFGDFIYSSNNLETGSIGLNKYGKACISPVYSIFKPIDIADSDFLGRRLVRKDFINTMVKWRQGVIYGQWRIHESDFLNIDILVPVTDEQQRIGKLLDDIDHLITLHQRKLDKLINVKKSTLEKMFPKQGSTVPEVRFSGFTEDWEQRKLSEVILDIADGPFGSNLKSEHYTDEKEARIIQLSNLSDYGWQEENTKYTTFKHAKDIKRCIVKDDELVMGKMMPAGMTIKCPNIEKMYVLSSDCVRIKLNTKIITTDFFLYLTKSDSFLGQVNNDSQGSTRVRTSISKIKKISFSDPIIEEQYKVSLYLVQLDHLITLHQRKLEKLKNIKKSMLEKMFI